MSIRRGKPAKDMLGQRRPHVIAQVAIGADEQRQPNGHRRRSTSFE